MTKRIEIDRKKCLRDEPRKGHNRWHPDIAPVIEAEPGEEVTLETRDANDLQIGPATTAKDLEKLKRTVAHPLTEPVYVKGAKRGVLLP
jgi:formamidase